MNVLNYFRNKFLPVLMVPVILVLHGFRGPASTEEYAVKAMFIYNFTKYFDWSRFESKPDFVIAVYGNSPVVKYLDEISHRKTINNKPIVIKVVSAASECSGAQMVFVAENGLHNGEVIKHCLANTNQIIVTESRNDYIKGAHINLVNVDGKLRFELNELRMKNNSIKFSRELAALAIKSN